MPDVGIELTTYRLQGGCSTTELIRLNCLVEDVGVEPTDRITTVYRLAICCITVLPAFRTCYYIVNSNHCQLKIMVVVVGIDPTSSAYEAGAHPSTPYNQNCFGVTTGNRTQTKRITISVANRYNMATPKKSTILWQTHCGQASNLHSPP